MTLIVLGLIAALALAGLMLDVRFGPDFRASSGVAEMIAGAVPLMPDLGSVHLWSVTMLGILGILAAAGFAWLQVRRSLAMVGVAALLMLLGIRTHVALSDGVDFAAPSRAVELVMNCPLPAGARVTFGIAPQALHPDLPTVTQKYYSNLYQWLLPANSFKVIESGNYPSDGWAFAPSRDLILTERGEQIVWSDPVVPISLWRLGHGSDHKSVSACD